MPKPTIKTWAELNVKNKRTVLSRVQQPCTTDTAAADTDSMKPQQRVLLKKSSRDTTAKSLSVGQATQFVTVDREDDKENTLPSRKKQRLEQQQQKRQQPNNTKHGEKMRASNTRPNVSGASGVPTVKSKRNTVPKGFNLSTSSRSMSTTVISADNTANTARSKSKSGSEKGSASRREKLVNNAITARPSRTTQRSTTKETPAVDSVLSKTDNTSTADTGENTSSPAKSSPQKNTTFTGIPFVAKRKRTVAVAPKLGRR